MKKIVVALSSFKESMENVTACDVAARVLPPLIPDAAFTFVPVADGGDGTFHFMRWLYPLSKIRYLTVPNAYGYRMKCPFLQLDRESYFVESAMVVGLKMTPPAKRNPLKTSTAGLGEMIREIIGGGGKKIILGVGGTATVDAGKGIFDILGFDFDGVEFTILCDVDVPLTGKNGCVRIFSPQKGANATAIAALERRFDRLVRRIRDKYAIDLDRCFGAGAGGGIPALFNLLPHTTIVSGSDFVMKKSGLVRLIRDADMVIVGEGRIDSTTFLGKVTGRIIQLCKRYRVECRAISGADSNAYSPLVSLEKLAGSKRLSMSYPIPIFKMALNAVA